ncbi:MAG: MipA/OmpV family protein [Bacteriovorax sp.]|jgi:outer membrane scaffolding protein for murein synthesis (MipA/OmpV family)
MLKSVPIIFLYIILICQTSIAGVTEIQKKELEWGAGLLNIYANHYRGSDQWKHWIFPIPYFSYASEHLEAEPSFVRGIFFHNEWFAFKLSLMAGLNVESKDNRARQGMPSLDYTFEAGPMLLFHLWKSQNKEMVLNFEWPIRKIFATDLSYLSQVGVYTVPYFNLIHTATPEVWNWSSEFSLGPMFGDRKYHEYFYNVDQQYASATRPVYRARGGYSGFQTNLVLNKRLKHFVLIPFFRWDYLEKAAFAESPLVKVKNYGLAGLGFFWVF